MRRFVFLNSKESANIDTTLLNMRERVCEIMGSIIGEQADVGGMIAVNQNDMYGKLRAIKEYIDYIRNEFE